MKWEEMRDLAAVHHEGMYRKVIKQRSHKDAASFIAGVGWCLENPPWRSVEKELPIPWEFVQVTNGNQTFVGFVSPNEDGTMEWNISAINFDGEPTHWLPLAKPIKE